MQPAGHRAAGFRHPVELLQQRNRNEHGAQRGLCHAGQHDALRRQPAGPHGAVGRHRLRKLLLGLRFGGRLRRFARRRQDPHLLARPLRRNRPGQHAHQIHRQAAARRSHPQQHLRAGALSAGLLPLPAGRPVPQHPADPQRPRRRQPRERADAAEQHARRLPANHQGHGGSGSAGPHSRRIAIAGPCQPIDRLRNAGARGPLHGGLPREGAGNVRQGQGVRPKSHRHGKPRDERLLRAGLHQLHPGQVRRGRKPFRSGVLGHERGDLHHDGRHGRPQQRHRLFEHEHHRRHREIGRRSLRLLHRRDPHDALFLHALRDRRPAARLDHRTLHLQHDDGYQEPN